MAYNAWGQRNYAWPANPPAEVKSFGYNARWGYRTDDATGLVYCQNRYYDPANGRWLTRDPISYSGGINLYGYCGGGPVCGIDPEGLWRSIVGAIGGGVVGFIFGGSAGAVAGSAFGAGLGASADELERQMANGENVDFGRAAKAGATAAVVDVVCTVTFLKVGKYASKLYKAIKLQKRLKGKPGWQGNKFPWSKPDPTAAGRPHTTISGGKKPSSRGGEYQQGFTWDKDGNLVGRTDLTDHADPVNHPWMMPNGKPGHWVPWNGPQGGWGENTGIPFSP